MKPEVRGLVVVVLAASCAHPPRSAERPDCERQVPAVVQFLDENTEPGVRALTCEDGVWDEAGRRIASEEAHRRCDATGCMWWTIREGEGDMAPLTELCGAAHESTETKRPVLGFHLCYWLWFDDSRSRIIEAAIKSVT